jgi:hypothetical protein
MKTVHVLTLVAGLATAGCTGDRNREVAVSDSLSHDLELAPSDTLAPEPLPEPTPVATDTAGSRASRVKVGARTPVATKLPAARRPTGSRSRRPARTTTTARDSAATEAYAPRADGADTARPKARPEPAAAKPPAPTTPGTDTASPPRVATRPVDSAARAPVPTPATPGAPASAPGASSVPPAANTLPVGTEFRAQLKDTINSLRNSEGQTVTALVSGDVRAPDGLTVLPSGSTVHVYIARLRPARTRSAKDGELELRVDSITVPGHSYAVRADVGPVPHELRGRGVTAGEVEKVGAGAAAGAVVGGVVTGKTKGAVIGGVIGAAGGGVVAAQTASRDVVVTPGTLLTLVLREPVTRVGR